MGETIARHVLVIEDDADVRICLCEILEEEGYRVSAARDGAEGRTLLDAGGIDLVVLDMVLPGRISSGELLKDLERKKTRVILISGYLEYKMPFPEADYPFLAKPFRARRLLDTVAEALTVHTRDPSRGAPSRSASGHQLAAPCLREHQAGRDQESV